MVSISTSLTGVSTTSPAMRLLVEPLAVHLDRGRHGHALHDVAEELGERLVHGLPGGGKAGLREVAGEVAGIRAHAEAHGALVLLGQVDEEAGELRGSADEHDQQSGGERVQRARVSDLLHVGAHLPAHPRDHVVRREALGLVDQEDAVERRLSSSELSHAITSRGLSSLENPAARRWPPPPCRAASALTSMDSERRLTRTRAPPSCSLTTAATSTPSTPRRLSTMPSVSSRAGAGGGEVRGFHCGEERPAAGDGDGAAHRPRPEAQRGQRAALVEQAVQGGHVDAELDQPGRGAERLRRGAVVVEVAGVERDARVQRRGGGRRRPQLQRAGDVAHQLAGAAGVAAHEGEVAVARVVVVVVDVHGDAAPRAGRQREPLRIAGVERVERRVAGRGAAAHALRRQQFVAERQKLALGDVQHSVDLELTEEVEHAGGGAERVQVGLLVHGQRDAALGAHTPAEGVEVGRERLHSRSSPSWSGGASRPSSARAGGASSAGPASAVVGSADDDLRRLLAQHLFLALQGALDAQRVVERVVVEELELGRALHVQRGIDLRLQEAARLLQGRHRQVALGLAAEHADEHLGVTQVGGRLDPRDGDEADAGVLETLRGDDRGEGLLDALVDPQESKSHTVSTGSVVLSSTRATSKSCAWR